MKLAATHYRNSRTPGMLGLPAGIFFIGMIVALGLASCKKSEPAAAVTSADPPATEKNMHFRIVSLSPAITDILLDLELDSFVVGRDAWDEQLTKEIPRVGDLSNLDLEALISLRPTDVILQAGRRGTPTTLTALAETQGWNVINRQIDNLDDLFATVNALVEDLSMGGDENLRAEARLREQTLALEFAAVTRPLAETVQLKWGTVLLLYSNNPPAAFGPGSYLADVLERLGLRNALTEGGAWQELDAETIMHLNPAVIVTLTIGSTKMAGKTANLGKLETLPLTAVRAGRYFQVSHPQAHLPGTCIIEIAAQLRDIFDPPGNTPDMVTGGGGGGGGMGEGGN